MTRTCLSRTALAVLLGWAICAGWSRAGENNPIWPHIPAGSTELPPGYPPLDNSPSRHPIRDWWHTGRPLFCWASFNGYGCSSRHATAVFIFGSCRQFYSEPCLKGPPPSALPPWAGARSGFRPLDSPPGVGPYGPAIPPAVPFQAKPEGGPPGQGIPPQASPDYCPTCGRW
jgi:hypothetical protein